MQHANQIMTIIMAYAYNISNSGFKTSIQKGQSTYAVT